MSLRSIHLRKLLKILYSDQSRRISALRSDIREDIAREQGNAEGGGDFYGPFWRDAKDHVFGFSDLTDTTRARLEANTRRANLYPRLHDGFLLWWNERRRWTNEPFYPADTLKAYVSIESLNSTIKIDNILAVRDAHGEDHFVYPYFSPEPILNEEAARLGLWILQQGFPTVPVACFRVLDVMRGITFNIDRNPLRGDESDILLRRYSSALDESDQLRIEYS